MRILVIEADPDISYALDIMLTQKGYQVDLAPNGDNIFANNFTLPDLFLIDQQLGTNEGQRIFSHLKSQVNSKDIPIIVMSSSRNLGLQALRAGATNVLNKPFEMKEIIRMIETTI
jgi:DNA-binding response OmpR family regulator